MPHRPRPGSVRVRGFFSLAAARPPVPAQTFGTTAGDVGCTASRALASHLHPASDFVRFGGRRPGFPFLPAPIQLVPPRHLDARKVRILVLYGLASLRDLFSGISIPATTARKMGARKASSRIDKTNRSAKRVHRALLWSNGNARQKIAHGARIEALADGRRHPSLRRSMFGCVPYPSRSARWPAMTE